MKLSYWEQKQYFSNTDIIIIGSGIVGLSAALFLRKKSKKLNILVLERGILPSGASTKNAGFACFGSSSELLDDLKSHTEEEVFSLVEKRWKGLQKLRKNLGDKAIDFTNLGGYELFDNETVYASCLNKLDYLNRQLKYIDKKGVYFNADKQIKNFGLKNVNHLIVNKAEAQIDTGKMMQALIKKVINNNIHILNGIEIKSLNDTGKNVELITSSGQIIKSKKVIIATNGFAKQFLPHENINPARAQVLITEPIKNLKLKGTFHYDCGYYYFRNIDNRILLGGGRNLDLKGETTTEMDTTKLIQDKLEELLYTTIIPYAKPKIEMRWSGIMGIGNKKQSIVKATSKNVYCAIRMGGMGVAIGSLVGEEVADIVYNSSG